MDSINAARQTIPLAWFDAARCAKGLEALREYKAEWSEEFRTFKKTPLHNWASHAADAFRYLAMAWREPMADDDSEQTPEQVIAEILRPRTLDQMFAAYAEERADAGYEVESWPLELS